MFQVAQTMDKLKKQTKHNSRKIVDAESLDNGRARFAFRETQNLPKSDYEQIHTPPPLFRSPFRGSIPISSVPNGKTVSNGQQSAAQIRRRKAICVDRFSRVFFPVTFGLMNCFYWGVFWLYL